MDIQDLDAFNALVAGVPEVTLKALAIKLEPFLNKPKDFEVRLVRMTRHASGKTVAFCDLAFCAGGQELVKVCGFRVLRNPDDMSMWLTVPQRKDERQPETKWIDTFSFQNKEMEKLARRVAVDEFKRLEAEDAPFG